MRSLVLMIGVVVLGSFLTGCGDKEPAAYERINYPPTNRIATAFQYTQVPKPCRVFAELLVSLPSDTTGKSIQQSVFKEAGSKGADLVLIGQSRVREDDDGLLFNYYGPKAEYLCSDKWCGWKYGFDEWEEQGDWVNIGFKEWGNQEIRYDIPIMMQVAFLRCR